MKKIVLVTLGVLLISSTASAAFSDVNSSHPNFEAIEYVQSQGIVQGYEDGTYQPDNLINRAEFTKIVMEASVNDSVLNECTDESFNDVPLDQWFAKYVCAAKLFQVIDGYSDGTFRPTENIVFVEASKILVNTFLLPTEADPEVWYKNYVTLLGEFGVIPTSINEFGQKLTRGQMAEMIWRLDTETWTQPSKTYNELAGIEEPEPENFTGAVLAGDVSPVLDFNQADYEKALGSKKYVLLYFYADWCPLCRAEIPKFYEVMEELNNPDVIGFRVNFNDNFTDDDEEGMARQFNIIYQHSKVFLKDGEEVLKNFQTWEKEDYETEINNLLN